MAHPRFTTPEEAMRAVTEDIILRAVKMAKKKGSASGFVLFSVRERLDLLGGRMQIESLPGAGSRLMVLVPLVSSAAEVFHAGS